MKRILTSALLGAFAGAVLVYPRAAFDAAAEGLLSFATGLLPALLPLLTALLLLSSRVKDCRLLLPLAALSGAPGGARLLAPRCTGKGALLCAAVSGTLSPMFFLGTLAAWTNGARFAALLYAVHLLSMALSALPLLLGAALPKDKDITPLSLGAAALEAARAMLIACVLVTLGCVASGLLAVIFPALSPLSRSALSALVEIAGGARQLCALPLTRGELFLLLSFFCAFGGLSVQAQNAAFLSKSGVKGVQLCLLGLFRGLLALLLGLLLRPLV